MKDLKMLFGLLLATIVYCYLMWYQDLGVNALIFSVLLIAGIAVYKKAYLHKTFIITAAMFFTSSLAVVITGLTYAKVMYYVTMFIFLGASQTPQLRNICYIIISAIANFFAGLLPVSEMFISGLKNIFSIKKVKSSSIGRVLIVTGLLIVFFFLFSKANPRFAELTDNLLDPIINLFSNFKFWNIIHFIWVFYFLSLFFVGMKVGRLEQEDIKSEDNLTRKRSWLRSVNLSMALKNEYKTAKLAIIAINILLFTLNLTDIFSVWFGVVSDSASELSSFVHSGTYTLIFSVLLSIVILIYFFRKNLNLYPNNKGLKIIAYIWIVQNMFLLCSVALRNYHYVTSFGLTYKRIGVFIFLLITCVSLVFLLLKIRDKKTIYYYVKMCTYGMFITLVITALFNWDVIICKYNINNAEFKDNSYMRGLSDQVYPYSDESNFYRNRTYINKIEAKDWQSFNFGDYNTVKKLRAIPINQYTSPMHNTKPIDSSIMDLRD